MTTLRPLFIPGGGSSAGLLENMVTMVTLGHHHGDAVETFLCASFSGQIRTFMPKSYLTGRGRRHSSWYPAGGGDQKGRRFLPFTPAKPVCFIAGTSYRQKVKDLLRELARDRRWVYTNLASAMREGSPISFGRPSGHRAFLGLPGQTGMTTSARNKNAGLPRPASGKNRRFACPVSAMT